METKIKTKTKAKINDEYVEINGIRIEKTSYRWLEKWTILKEKKYTDKFNYFMKEFSGYITEIEYITNSFDNQLIIVSKIRNNGRFRFYIADTKKEIIELVDRAFNDAYYKLYCKNLYYTFPGYYEFFREKLCRIDADFEEFKKFKNGDFYILVCEIN